MCNSSLIMEKAQQYYDECQSNTFDREKAWAYCYKSFCDACVNHKDSKNDLSLILTSYLASWGMYVRGSFLLKCDYHVHDRVVELLLDQRWKDLYDIDWSKDDEEKKKMIERIEGLYKEIASHYAVVREKVKNNAKNEVSQILITKILLGTMGCVPAFDENAKKGINELKMDARGFKKKMFCMAKCVSDNRDKFSDFINQNPLDGVKYTQMKVMDMALWQIGNDNKNN